MQIAVQQENLKKALARVGRAIPGKPVFPAISNVLLVADGTRLRLSGTDLTLGVTVWIGAQVEQSGSVLLPAGLLRDIVAGLPNDRVQIAVDATTRMATVTCARFSAQINGADPEEFPAVPHTPPDAESPVSFSAAALRDAIPRVACAAADGDARPVLAGVYLRLHEQTALLAAADGFRLATTSIALPTPVAEPHEILIPAPALRELGGLLSDGSEQVAMSLLNPTAARGAVTQVLFTTAHWTLATRLIEGRFPDFERILPKQSATRAVLDVRELSRAVKLAGLIAGVSQNVVKLSLNPTENGQPGTLLLSANAAGIGENTSTVDGEVSGEGGQIALNVKYLSDALAVIGTPRVTFEMVSHQAPGVLRPTGSNGAAPASVGDYLHLIMPMALR
jgi:DNA polymerase-3 subunit beta